MIQKHVHIRGPIFFGTESEIASGASDCQWYFKIVDRHLPPARVRRRNYQNQLITFGLFDFFGTM